MTVNLSQAAAAYARVAAEAAGSGVPGSKVSGESFAEVMSQAVSGAAATIRTSETVSMQAVANQADLNEIVSAVNNAEMTLQTVVAVRDKVITAYQEILRMPI